MEKKIEDEMKQKSPAMVKKLCLDNCKSTHIVGLTDKYVNLKSLSLKNIGLTTLEGFPKLPNLKGLDLGHNSISSGLHFLYGSPELTFLNLRGNNIRDIETLKPLDKFKKLTTLDITICEVITVENYEYEIFNLIRSLKYLYAMVRFDRTNDGIKIYSGDDTSENDSDKDTGSQEEDEKREIVTLITNLEDMFINSKNTDVTLKVKDKEFQAHSFILAARSPVLDSMFQHHMTEKDTGIVHITDCDPNVFHMFLLFLYTGRLKVNDSRDAALLYKIADKYQILGLKKACLRCMKKLTDESFCDIASIAAMHDETNLLEMITQYFIKNAKSILRTESWKNFIAEQTVIANELLIKFADNVQ